MPNTRFFCVICGKALSLPSRFARSTTECPSCFRVVPVPALIHVAGESAGCVAAFAPDVLQIEVTFLCGKCEARLATDARWEERTLSCPVCNALTAVPRWSVNARERADDLPSLEFDTFTESPVPVATGLLSAAEIEFLSGEADMGARARRAG